MKLKTILGLAALCVPLAAAAITDDDIEHEPLLARTAHNYEIACALQFKIFGILALSIKQDNPKYLEFAHVKFVQYNYPSGSFLNSVGQLEYDHELMEIMSEWGEPSADMDKIPSLKQAVEVCATNPRIKLLNFYTAFYGAY